jgi:hypothetical protein
MASPEEAVTGHMQIGVVDHEGEDTFIDMCIRDQRALDQQPEMWARLDRTPPAESAPSRFKGDDPSSEFASTDSNDHIAGRYRERAMADGERRRPTVQDGHAGRPTHRRPSHRRPTHR